MEQFLEGMKYTSERLKAASECEKLFISLNDTVMKKQTTIRNFNFADSKLVQLAHEKLAFMRRDATAFSDYGLTESEFSALETMTIDFENAETDGEALYTQTAITTQKEEKAEVLRVAIRGLMARVALKFPTNTAQYRKFGTEALAQQSDAELLVMAKNVVHVAQQVVDELVPNGVTQAMLTHISQLRDEVESLILAMKTAMGDRDIQQEIRIATANSIYSTLLKYTHTGLFIWSTSDVAKYNDYIIYEE
ncbi:hypothetical protein [Flavobacterium phycosphaerae]|uniref:hypothetical protein n=1 Tax=Flavobacterium phycosphaerae TaxID=2697515 RepID=UPI0013897F79|nr:hypothetical protein [Flavobacterium phycosphaerae]